MCGWGMGTDKNEWMLQIFHADLIQSCDFEAANQGLTQIGKR